MRRPLKEPKINANFRSGCTSILVRLLRPLRFILTPKRSRGRMNGHASWMSPTDDGVSPLLLFERN